MDHTFTRRAFIATGTAALASCRETGGLGRPGDGANIATAQDTSGAWSAGIDLPHAVQEIYPTLHAGRIHLVGGILSENGELIGATARHVSWAPGEPGWRDEPALPQALHHPQLVSWRGALFTLGGYEIGETLASFWKMQSTVWRLGPGADTWSPGPALPRPSGEAVSAVLNDQLHLTAGRRPSGEANARGADHEDAADHFVLPGPGGRWETAAPLPTARNSGATAIIDGAWHVVGGRFVTGGNAAAHEVYDPREDRWRRAAPMPQGQGGLAAAALNGKLYAFGGEFFSGDGGVYREAWSYDPRRDTWSPAPDMLRPRHGHGAVALDGAIYAIGGALKVAAADTTATVDVFRPA